MTDRGLDLSALPKEVRDQLAELDLELSEGDITQKGYEKKRTKLLAPYIIQAPVAPPQNDVQPPAPSSSSQAPPPASSSRYRERRSRRTHRGGGTRDDRYRSDVHSEAVQAALAKHKEEKMALPMPTKRRSTYVQSPIETRTPPDSSSGSDDETSVRRLSSVVAPPPPVNTSLQSPDCWINRSAQGSSTSSSASSTLSHGEAKPQPQSQPQPQYKPQYQPLYQPQYQPQEPSRTAAVTDMLAHSRIAPPENSAPFPDVTAVAPPSRGPRVDLPSKAVVRGMSRVQSRSSMMETADGRGNTQRVPVSSRVSTKIQQLLNTLKRPKRPPLSEFFTDDAEEIVQVPQPDPNTPKPEGRQIIPVKGEPLGVVSNWPPALQAALARWGATQGKSPALTALDITGKPLYTLTYGKLWSRSVKLAYTLLNKLGNKNEQILKPGDRVALVYPNSDPGMFWVAFYGCLLAEVIPVPIEVPLSRKDAGISQVGFLLGSCGVGLALTSEICLKGLPKTPTGEILQFKGWPRMKWVITDSKYLTKPSKDWQPHIPTANTDPGYIEYKANKEGTVVGVAVSKVAMLTHCQALTQACNYCEGETLVNVLDFKKDMGLWHGVLTAVMNRIHTISVPYAVMKACPLSWVQRVHIHKARVALVKCRDLHWAMMAHRDQRDISLASLRMLIVADGANPWSVSSCDAFLNLFQSHGLKPEVICPCAASPEAMTVAIRRPGVPGAPLPARAILSLSGLSHSVIRVNTEDKNSALTVQDVGHVMPGGGKDARVSKAACILTTQNLMRTLRSKEAAASVNIKTWPTIIDTDDLPRRRPPQIYKPPTAEMIAYLDFSVSTTGMLTGVKISHAAVSALCRSIKLQCELYSSRQIAICMDPYCGLGFVLWCLASVYSGHQSVLIPPFELESCLSLWLSTLSQYRIRDTFCSYSVMELCTKGLGTQTELLRARGVNLSCVRSCVVIAEERPRLALTQSFSKLFKDVGLSSRAVSTAFGSRVNLAICLQGTTGPDPCTVYVDMKSLRHDRVRLVERGAPQSLPLMESGKILPGVRVIIVNPETRGPLGDSHLGEIWVNSPHSASGYYTIYGEESLQADHFNTKLSFGDPHTLWARTGYLGFVKRTELLDASGDRHDALFVVGSLDETLELRGLRYHPIDIETSVSRAHRSIAESAVFTWTNLLVVVSELCGSEQDALDLVPLITNVVLEEHHLIVGVVVIVDPGVIPINSRGEKQRMHLRDSFLADQLDPIYVAYNM
ncbi:disco-interacting protein 2 homolog B-A [Nematolebias whitei]|uniref:disco-interacting protein 2 homolog B-A n=1 Tax=Nematolebias whitei TaxID=451745 RepID=UPI001897F09D|nr:disco-interacting protein 2 homolog B-A [Nematolebias whitei]